MAIIVGIVSAVVIVAFIVLIFFASGIRSRRKTLRGVEQPSAKPQEEKRRRVAGID